MKKSKNNGSSSLGEDGPKKEPDHAQVKKWFINDLVMVEILLNLMSKEFLGEMVPKLKAMAIEGGKPEMITEENLRKWIESGVLCITSLTRSPGLADMIVEHIRGVHMNNKARMEMEKNQTKLEL